MSWPKRRSLTTSRSFLRHLVRRADDHVAVFDDGVELARLLVDAGDRSLAAQRRLADLALDAGADRRLGGVAGRRGEARVDVQAAAVEVLGRLAVELPRLGFGLGDADELQEARTVRIRLLAEAFHLLPEAVHRLPRRLVAVVRQIAVDVVHLGAPLPRLDRPAAGNPDRRVRALDGARPDVDVALLVEAAVEGEGLRLGPRPGHEVVRLVVPLAQQRRILAVGRSRCPSASRPESRRSGGRRKCSRSSRTLPPPALAGCTAPSCCPSRRSPCVAPPGAPARSRSGWARASVRSRSNGARCSTRRRIRPPRHAPSRP